MQREHPARVLKVLGLPSLTAAQLEEALAYSQQATLSAFPKREITSVGQSLKPKAYEAAELVLKSLLLRFTKVFLLFSWDQLLTLLAACLSSKYSLQICEITLQYVQQLIQSLPLLAFRRVGEAVQVQLFEILTCLSGVLALLIPQLLQNNLITRLLKVLHSLTQRNAECSGTAVIGELLLVESVAVRLEDESRKGFCSFLKEIVKDERRQTLYNAVLNTGQDRLLDFSKLVIIRVVDDSLEKVDLNFNARSRTFFLLPSSAKCWPEWVEQSYQAKPPPAQIQPLMESTKVQDVYESFQHLELWASSPHVEDPTLHLNEQVTDLFISYLEGKLYSSRPYDFRMEKWKEKCSQIQEMLATVRERQKPALRELLSSML